MNAQKTELPIRSFLFIPGDSEKKFGKVDGTPADAFIFDLEDAVAPDAKPTARESAAAAAASVRVTVFGTRGFAI